MIRWVRTFLSRAWAMVGKDRLDREFDEELTTHLELLIDEGRRRGLSPNDARHEAMRRLGRPVALREAHREQRGLPVLDILAQDLRYAVRVLWKSPAFTGIAMLSLALGIGANTALFSLVDGLLLRSLPVRDPDGLVQVQYQMVEAIGGIRKPSVIFPAAAFDAVRRQDRVVSEVIGFQSLDRPEVSIDGAVEPPRQVEAVSHNFFRDLGVTPVVGRTPEPSDDAVAILSYRLWRARFDSSPNVVGRPVAIGGRVFTVIAVAPPRFLGLSLESSVDIWTSTREHDSLQMIARLKPGVSFGQAQAALQPVMQELARQRPEIAAGWTERRVELLPAGRGLSRLRAQYERPLLALTMLVSLLLLITCTNVGNLLIVRNAARRRELTVRAAVGASRARLVVQCLVECAVLAALGGVCALAFARWGVSILLSMLPVASVPEALAFQVDARLLAFTAGVSFLSALLFGLLPAWRATRVDLTTNLRASQGSTAPKEARRLGRSLVACQVGLSVLLLVGAGLFVQTLRNLARLDVGFEPDSLMQVSIDTRGAGYGPGQVSGVYRLLLERVGAIPGVRSVSGVRNPIMRNALSRSISRSRDGREASWDSAEVGPAFFETMGLTVVSGRTFTAADFNREGPCSVVNEAFVREYFPNEDPVGKHGIIGVVRDARLAGVRTSSGPMMYERARREPDRVNALVVRAAGDPVTIAPRVAQEVRRVNPRLLIEVRTMREEIDRSMATERIVAATSAFFSVLGLLLTSIGIFGVASYTVAQRTNELGIRMALGASRRSLIRASLQDTMFVFAAGLVGGIIAAVIGVRLSASFISNLLFGLTATDAVNIVGAVLVMIVAACAACILPAHRATRIDVLTAIRQD
jgi:predicted permease